MRIKTVLFCALSLLVMGGSVTALAAPIAMPPFTFVGRILSYLRVPYHLNGVAEVRVKAKDGTLLAKTQTGAYENASYNYVINIPLATEATTHNATVGEEVVFEFVDSTNGVFTGLVSAGDATIGRPGQVATVDVILAADTDGDGVPDEYVKDLEYDMWLRDIETYDAKADYDGDGISNYDEYVAGTDPFDETDRFAVEEMTTDDSSSEYVAFKVIVSSGRTYAVSSTDSLGKDDSKWTKEAFSVADPSSAPQTGLSTGPSEVGSRVLYLKKEGVSRFYRLTVE